LNDSLSVITSQTQQNSALTNKQLPQVPQRKEPLEMLEQGCPIELVHVSDRKIKEHEHE